MITRFEQVLGFITLVVLGTSVIFSRFVTLSAANYLSVNFHISQYGLGAMCYIFVIPLATGRRSRMIYFACLFPYILYWIATFRFTAVNSLAYTTASLETVLLIALLYGMIYDAIRWLVRSRFYNGKQHAAAG